VTDRIEIRGLRVHGRHGVLATERVAGQLFVADVTVHLDTSAAAASDELADTVDYAAVAGRVAAVLGGEPVALLETLAERIAGVVLEDERILEVEVTVHKPQAPVGVSVADVLVSLRRSRR